MAARAVSRDEDIRRPEPLAGLTDVRATPGRVRVVMFPEASWEEVARVAKAKGKHPMQVISEALALYAKT